MPLGPEVGVNAFTSLPPIDFLTWRSVAVVTRTSRQTTCRRPPPCRGCTCRPLDELLDAAAAVVTRCGVNAFTSFTLRLLSSSDTCCRLRTLAAADVLDGLLDVAPAVVVGRFGFLDESLLPSSRPESPDRCLAPVACACASMHLLIERARKYENTWFNRRSSLSVFG